MKQWENFEQSFGDYYQQNIFPLLSNLEKQRLKSLSKFKRNTVIASIIIIFSTYIYLNSAPSQNKQDFVFPLLSTFLIIVGGIALNPIWTFKDAGKAQLLPKIIAFWPTLKMGIKLTDFGMDAKYDYWRDIVKPNKLVPFDYSSTAVYDSFNGILNHVPVTCSELHILRGWGKRKSYYFKGFGIRIILNKNFNGHTILTKKRGSIENGLTFKNLDSVKLEDPQLSEWSQCFSTDQVEARYILTPAFIERLKELRSLNKLPVICSFMNNEAIMLVSVKDDWLETSNLFKSALQSESIFKVARQIYLVSEIIDILKTNSNIGLTN